MGGKKNKKVKPKRTTISLGTFLGASNAVGPDTSVVTARYEYGGDEDSTEKYVSAEKIVLPSCPRTSRGPAIDESMIPTTGPFVAHVGNLPFDSSEVELRGFFNDLKIVNIKLPTSDDGTRFKGYGYVEFETREDLIEAYALNEETLRNRKIRVSPPDSDNDGKGDFGRRNRGGWGDGREDRSQGVSDWRAAPPQKADEGGSRGGRFGGSRYDDDRRGGFGTGPSDDDPWRRKPGGFEDRRGGFDRRDGGYERRDGGYDRRDGGFDRRDGGFDRRDGGSFDRRGGGFSRPSDDPPKERPRLQLKPRSVPVSEGDSAVESESAKPSIFGDARPVNTAAKEMEIEQKKIKKEPVQPPAPSKASNADIFGAAKPVDTTEREMAIEQKLNKKLDLLKKDPVREPQKPSPADIFGAAKPVDTLAREREIEEKLKKSSDIIPPKPDTWRDRPDIDRRDGHPSRGGGGGRSDGRYGGRPDERSGRRPDERSGGKPDGPRGGHGPPKSRSPPDRNGVHPHSSDDDEERFRKAQPRNSDAPKSLDIANKFGNLDLEQEI